MRIEETVFALSSAPGKAGVAVIRVSGPDARLAVAVLTKREPPVARTLALRCLYHPQSGQLLDRALVAWFAGPHSFTGEDIAEFHVHGGRAVIGAVLDALGGLPGVRLAKAGEFCRRAFDNEKIGLTEAEGLADLIDAETEAQRRQALRQTSGELEVLYGHWRESLLAVLGLVEAAIDFSDEPDVSADAVRQGEDGAGELLRSITCHLDDGRRGEIVRDGFHVMLAGLPNAGKSSLLNAMVRREAAIVSPEAGTTRDIVEVVMDLEGFRIVVSDTAGIREGEGVVEREGVRRALALGERADLVVWLDDAGCQAGDIPAALVEGGADLVRVASKADLAPAGLDESAGVVRVSVRTGEGLEALEKLIIARARAAAGDREEPVLTQHRHREALQRAADGLQSFITARDAPIELRAEHLRYASRALGALVGRVDVEDVLGAIFGRFCIGK